MIPRYPTVFRTLWAGKSGRCLFLRCLPGSLGGNGNAPAVGFMSKKSPVKKSRVSRPVVEEEFDDPRDDVFRGAAVATAALAATDEEFAAGVPLKTPGAILSGEPSRSKKTGGKKTKPPDKPAEPKMVNPYSPEGKAKIEAEISSPEFRKKLKSGFQRVARLKRNERYLRSAQPAKKRPLD
jgi:hypothetical protein